MTARIFLARPLPGTVGETRRVVHVFPIPPEGEVPSRLAAFCGADFGPGELESLEGLTGMPCVSCLRNSPNVAELAGGA